MIEFEYVIQDKQGIHAGSASALVQIASRLTSRVTIQADGSEVDCTKLIPMMRLGVGYKDAVTFRLEGDNEETESEEFLTFCRNKL